MVCRFPGNQKLIYYSLNYLMQVNLYDFMLTLSYHWCMPKFPFHTNSFGCASLCSDGNALSKVLLTKVLIEFKVHDCDK